MPDERRLSFKWSTLRIAAKPRSATPKLELELALNQERNNHREQSNTFDERGKDDRARLNAASHLGLTRHAVHRLTGKATDTNARADYSETGTDAGAQHCPRTGIRSVEAGGLRNCLQ